MLPTKEKIVVALNEIEEFSPAPVILASDLKLLSDPLADLEGIASLVARDSALTADIIRCANSVYYGGGTSTGIFEAVQKVGVRETMRLLNLAVARIVSSRDLTCYGIHGTDYWAESLFNGLFMHRLAIETGGNDPEEAYTTGLLRYIGRLAINQTLEHLHGGLFWNGQDSLAEWERENVGLVQAEVGAKLLARWRFPESIVQAVGAQDAPATLPDGNWLADALFFASALLPQGTGTPFLPAIGTNWPEPPKVSTFMDHHDLTPDAVDAMLQATSATFDEIRENFGT